MAAPSSPAHIPSLPSASPTDNSVTDPGTSLSNNCDKVEGPQLNWILHDDEKKPDFTIRFDDLGDTDYNERFRKYKEDCARRLMAKYFSGKTFYGGNIFDENVTIDGESIKSSRWPCTGSYANPVQNFEEQTSFESVSPADIPTDTVKGQQQ